MMNYVELLSWWASVWCPDWGVPADRGCTSHTGGLTIVMVTSDLSENHAPYNKFVLYRTHVI